MSDTQQSSLLLRRSQFYQSSQQELQIKEISLLKSSKVKNNLDLPTAHVKLDYKSPLLKPGESPVLYSPIINHKSVNKHDQSYNEAMSPFKKSIKQMKNVIGLPNRSILLKPDLLGLKSVQNEYQNQSIQPQDQQWEFYEKKYTFVKNYNISHYNLKDFEIIEPLQEISEHNKQYLSYNKSKQIFYSIVYFRITEENEQRIQRYISILYTLTKIGKSNNIVKLLYTHLYEIDKEIGIDIELGDYERRIILLIEIGESNLAQLKNARNKKNMPWAEEEILYITTSVIKGLLFLQSIRVCHRNIQESNVIYSKGIYKLTDFSNATFIAKQQKSKKPENSKTSEYSKDIYQLGLMIIRLCLLEEPQDFQDDIDTNNQQQQYIEEKLNQLKLNYPNIQKLVSTMINTNNTQDIIDYQQLLNTISKLTIQQSKPNETQFTEQIQLNYQQKRFQKQDLITMQKIAEGYTQIKNYQKSNQFQKLISEIHLQSKQYDDLVKTLSKIAQNELYQNYKNDTLQYINRINLYIDRLMLEDQEKAAFCQQQLAKIYYTLEDYDNCLNYLQKSLSSYIEQFGGDDTRCAQIYVEIFQCQMKQTKFKEAQEILDLAINHYERNLEKEHPIVARLFIFKADLQARLDLKSSAVKSYSRARGIIDQFFPNDLSKRVSYMNKEGLFCISLGLKKKALEIFKSIMILLEQQENQDVDIQALSECYEHIADVQLALNDYSMSLQNYLKCLKQRDKYYYDGHPEKMRILHIIAELLLKQDSDRALGFYERLLLNYQYIYGSGTAPQDLDMLECIGNLHFDKKNYRKALECFSFASELMVKMQNSTKKLLLQINVKSTEQQSFEYQIIQKLKIFATRYTQINNFNKVKTYLAKAEQFCIEKNGRNSLEYAQLLEDISQFYEDDGNLNKALQLSRESLHIQKNIISISPTKDFAELMFKIANKEMIFGFIDTATSNFEESLKIFQNFYGKNSLQVCECLDQMAYLYLIQYNVKKTKECILLATQLRNQQIPIKQDIKALNILRRQIQLSLQFEQIKLAEQHFKKLDEIIQKQLSNNTLDEKYQQELHFILLQYKCVIFAKKYQMKESSEKFKEGLAILSNLRNDLQYTLDDIQFLINGAETHLKMYDLEQFQLIWEKINKNVQHNYRNHNIFILELDILQCKHQLLRQNFQRANEDITHAKELCELFYGQDTFKMFLIYQLQGQVLLELEQYQQAESSFENASNLIQSYQDEIGRNSIFEAQITEDLAWLKYKQYQVHSASDLIEKTKILKVEFYNDQDLKHPEILQCLVKQSHIYIKLGKYSKANRRIDHILQYSKLFYGENHPFFAKVLILQANYYLNFQKFKECKQCLNQALVIAEDYFGKESLIKNKIDILQAQLLFDKGHIDSALKLLLNAKIDHQNKYQLNSQVSAVIYQLLGDIYRIQSQQEKSQKEYDKAEKIIEKIFGEQQHISCATIYYKRALLKFEWRQLNESLEYANISEQLTNKISNEQSNKSESLFKAHLYDLFAKIHLELNQLDKAHQYIVKSLDIKKVFGERCVEYLLSMTINQDINDKQDNQRSVTDICLKLLNLMKDSHGVNSYCYQLIRLRQADQYYWRFNHDDSLKIYEDILQYFNKNLNPEHLVIAHIELKQSSIYYYKNQQNKQIKLLSHASQLYTLHLGSDNFYESLISYEYALMYFKQQEFENTLQKVKSGQTILEKYVGDIHTQLILFINLEVQCLLELNHISEAYNTIKKAMMQFADQIRNSGFYSTYIQQAYGLYYHKISQHEKSFEHLNISLTNREKIMSVIHPEYIELKQKANQVFSMLSIDMQQQLQREFMRNYVVYQRLDSEEDQIALKEGKYNGIYQQQINKNTKSLENIQSFNSLHKVFKQPDSQDVTPRKKYVNQQQHKKYMLSQAHNQFSLPQVISLNIVKTQAISIVPAKLTLPTINKTKFSLHDHEAKAFQETNNILNKNTNPVAPPNNKYSSNKSTIRGRYVAPINKSILTS